MNLPVGEIVQQRVNSKEFDEAKEVIALIDNEFSGYLVSTIEGFGGIEEGILVLKKGSLIGAVYEYTNYGITVFGETALPQVFNSLAAEYGVIDIVSLSVDQVDLVVAFNDKVKFRAGVGKKELPKLFMDKFSASYAEKVLSDVLKKHESRKTIFEKLGLSELGK